MRRIGSAIVICAAATALSASVACAAPQFTVGNIPAYFEGKFGTSSNIRIFYDATYAQLKYDRLRVKLIVPYLYVRGLPVGSQISQSSVVNRSTSPQTENESGLGDTWLNAHLTVLKRHGVIPAVIPYAKVKFSTGSVSKGLGTGHDDYEFGVGLQNRLGRRVFPFVTVGYRFIGTVRQFHTRDIWTYTAGSSFLVTNKNVFTALFAGEESQQPGFQAPADAIVAWDYKMTPAGSGPYLFADKGFTNGSPKFGAGLGFQWVF